MKIAKNTVRGTFFLKLTRLIQNYMMKKNAGDELPLRTELFSAEQMKQHGKTLAESHQLQSGRPRKSLLKRLADNESLLLEVYNQLTEDVMADIRITPAAEWLLDNFYLIEEQIHTAKRHLSKECD